MFTKAESEFVRDDWFYADGFHTGHLMPEYMYLPPTEAEQKAAAARIPSDELEHALAALEDRWPSFECNRNLLLMDTLERLHRRSPRAAEAFGNARVSLRGKRFMLRSFLPVLRTLARLELARLETLLML
jgi:hypothetical protein